MRQQIIKRIESLLRQVGHNNLLDGAWKGFPQINVHIPHLYPPSGYVIHPKVVQMSVAQVAALNLWSNVLEGELLGYLEKIILLKSQPEPIKETEKSNG